MNQMQVEKLNGFFAKSKKVTYPIQLASFGTVVVALALGCSKDSFTYFQAKCLKFYDIKEGSLKADG